jgi:hypothetical protein
MGDKTRGMYEKFKVERTDGSSVPGGKHDGCQYFVLDAIHDPFAIAALIAYAEACEGEYPLLARDVENMAIRNCDHEWIDSNGPRHCVFCGYEPEPPEDDGECFRGGEAASYSAEQQARIQRELK